MWVFLPEAFLSIVQSPEGEDYLVVRAVREGDIEAVFGKETHVKVDAGSHYRFRTLLERETVTRILSQEIELIEYNQFVGFVSNPQRKRAYSQVAGILSEFQSHDSSSSPCRPSDLLKSDPWDLAPNPMGRLILTVAGYWRHHGAWPTKLIVSEDQLMPIRRYYLTPLGLRVLRSKLQIMPIPSCGVFIAIGDEGQTHSYDAQGASGEEAERWLGFK